MPTDTKPTSGDYFTVHAADGTTSYMTLEELPRIYREMASMDTTIREIIVNRQGGTSERWVRAYWVVNPESFRVVPEGSMDQGTTYRRALDLAIEMAMEEERHRKAKAKGISARVNSLLKEREKLAP